ncbi:hypothetical protein DMP14_27180 [Pseudonocardia sp. Ae707_Ps2]
MPSVCSTTSECRLSSAGSACRGLIGNHQVSSGVAATGTTSPASRSVRQTWRPMTAGTSTTSSTSPVASMTSAPGPGTSGQPWSAYSRAAARSSAP